MKSLLAVACALFVGVAPAYAHQTLDEHGEPIPHTHGDDDLPEPKSRAEEEESLEEDMDRARSRTRRRRPSREERYEEEEERDYREERRRRRRDYEDEERERGDARPGRKHDAFYLHFGLGFGYAEARSAGATTRNDNFDEGISDVRVRGFAIAPDFELGGTPAENFVLYGKLGFYSVSEPLVEIDGVEETFVNTDFTTFYLGGGAAFFLPEPNIKLAVAGTIGGMGVSSGDIQGATDTGYMLHLTAAKEWWVGRNWGIGADVRASFGQFPERGLDVEPWRFISLVVGFSATLN